MSEIKGHDLIIERDNLPVIIKDWNPIENKEKFNSGGMAMKTYNYFDPADVSSAYQKAVRRGFNSDAIQWALELFYTNQNRRTNIWNRSLVISVEDIGPADPSVIIEINHLYNNYSEDPKAIVTAALILCQSKKRRVNDWSAHICPELHEEGSGDNLIENDDPEEMKKKLIIALQKKDSGESIFWTDVLTFT